MLFKDIAHDEIFDHYYVYTILGKYAEYMNPPSIDVSISKISCKKNLHFGKSQVCIVFMKCIYLQSNYALCSC